MKFKRLIALFCVALMTMAFPLTSFAADEKKKEIPLPVYTEHLPYYYYQLENKDQKQLYLTFRKALIEQKSTLSFTTSQSQEFIDDMMKILVYNDDYAFNLERWYITAYTRNGKNTGKYKYDFMYTHSSNVYRQMVQYVDNNVEKFLATIPEGTGAFTKVLKIHDYIVESCDYDMQDKYCDTAYGALIGGKALCEGYTRAFNYICNEAGIYSVMSYSDPARGESYGHAWNKVKIGKNWYIVDATNNDQSPVIKKAGHDMLFLSDAEYTVAIEVDEKIIKEPEATDDTRSYYEQTKRQVKTADAANAYIKQVMTEDAKLPLVLEFEITSDNEFAKFIQNAGYYITEDIPYRGAFSVKWIYTEHTNVVHIIFTKS
jgi:hypothetical protein